MKWIAIAYGIASLITLVMYGWDKRRAIKGGSRVPERTLHLGELLGGWPGALLAQKMFRHKTQKASFRRVFWLIVVLHVIAWGAWIYWQKPWA